MSHAQIKQLIEKGKVKEALEAMRSEFPDATLLLAQWNRGEKDHLLGLTDNSEWQKIYNKLTYAALALLSEATPEPPQSGNSAPVNNLHTQQNPPPQTLRLFLSYARADAALKQRFDVHLAGLKRSGKISTWSDSDLDPGVEWDQAIKQRLEEADVILLLISPDFMASDYIWGVEIESAMQRHRAGQALIIPIFLKDTVWQDAPFAKLQGLPRDGKAVNQHPDPEPVLAAIAKEIRTAIDKKLDA